MARAGAAGAVSCTRFIRTPSFRPGRRANPQRPDARVRVLRVDEPVEVSPLLTALPLGLGIFSVVLFGLNALGLFGEGPDLDSLAQ